MSGKRNRIMTSVPAHRPPATERVAIRVRGTVQGVGFRPTVWRIARECGLRGEVLNDGAGVLIHAAGSTEALRVFLERLDAEAPPLSHIDAVETFPFTGEIDNEEFLIAESVAGRTRTHVAPDAAICDACREEIQSSFERRVRGRCADPRCRQH